MPPTLRNAATAYPPPPVPNLPTRIARGARVVNVNYDAPLRLRVLEGATLMGYLAPPGVVQCGWKKTRAYTYPQRR